jgi:predicted nucleotidyltransferase
LGLGARPALAEPASDVDIGVKPKQGKSFSVREKSEIAVALEDILLVHRIDLVVLPEADPFPAANIMRGERLFSHDAHAADEYDRYILRRAGDLAPLERERQSLMQARFAPSCSRELGDVTKIRTAFLGWLDSHPDMADGSLEKCRSSGVRFHDDES